MKKFTLLAGFLLALSAFQLKAQDAPITIAPDLIETPGTTIQVPITVQNFIDIGGFSLTLLFDPAVLTFQDVVFNPVFSTTGYNGLAIPGRVLLFGGDVIPPAGITLPGGSVILTITFDYHGGFSELKWEDSTPYDCEYFDNTEDLNALNDIPHENFYINGSVSSGVGNGPLTIAPHVLGIPGTTVSVPITVRQFNEIGAISLMLLYNPGVLEFTGFVNFSMFPNLTANGLPGMAVIGGFSDNPAGHSLMDDAILIMLNFNYLGGYTDLLWDDAAPENCEYAGPYPDYNALNDDPFASFYQNGSVSSYASAPQTIAPEMLAIPGTTIAVPITVKQFQNVGALSLTLEYLPGVLVYQNFINASGFPGLSVNSPYPGLITAGGVSPTDASGINLPDDAVLFYIQFDYLGGYTDLTWFYELPTSTDCEYGDWPEYNYMIDIPGEDYYINGWIDSYAFAPVTIIPDVTACQNTEVCIPVTVQNFINVGALSLNIYYTTGSLTYTGFTNDSGFPLLQVNEPIPGQLYIGGFSDDLAINLNDDDILFTMCFDYTVGTASLTFFDDGASSEYADWPDYNFMIDMPQNEYYFDGSVNAYPQNVVSDVTLQFSPAQVGPPWTAADGDFTSGFSICLDQVSYAGQYYYLDVNTFESNVALQEDFLNPFYLTAVTSADFNDWWAEKFIGWPQAYIDIMQPILDGTSPMFYIKYSGGDYQLIDGFKYQLDGSEETLRLNADYPPGTYTFNGKVLDINSCLSDEVEVIITFGNTSTYEFVYEVPAFFCAASVSSVDITFQTDVEGDCGYDNVRFKIESSGPGTVTFGAYDSNNVYQTFDDEGFWGPDFGFDLPALYSATTTWDLTFSAAGEYSITFSLIEAPDGAVIAGISETINVTVNAEPELVCPADISVNNIPGLCEALVSFEATATGTPTPTITYYVDGFVITSPHTFPVGTTTVLVEAENACGLVTCSFEVTVVDNEPPSVTCPDDLIVNTDPGTCEWESQPGYLTPLAADNCGNVSVTWQVQMEGTTLSDAEILAEWNFEDAAKRALIANNSQFIANPYTADDGIPANIDISIITLNGGPTFPNAGWVGGSGGGGTFAPNSNNWHAGGEKYWGIVINTVGYANLELSSKQYGSGTGPRDFKVQYSLNGADWFDVAGSEITVATNWTSGVLTDLLLPAACDDQTALYLRWLNTSNINVRAGTGTFSPADPVQSGGTNRMDDIIIKGYIPTQGVITLTGNNDASGVVFPLGTSTVTYFVNDEAGNTNECSFTVTVLDNQAPIVQEPDGSATVECLSAAVQPVPPIALDNCDGAIAGNLFGFVDTPAIIECEGQRVYTFNYTDAAGNTATWTFTYLIVRSTPPSELGQVPTSGTIECLDDILGAISLDVIAYWNFNDNTPPTNTNWDQPIPATAGNGEITYTFTQAYSFFGTTINGLGVEVEGGSLAPRGGFDSGNNGAYLEIAASTVGYSNIVMSYPTRRTSTGFTTHEILYTIDGNDWISKEVIDISGFANNWMPDQLVMIDFRDVAGVENNPDFAIRVVLTGATSETGNNRIDNLRLVSQPAGSFVLPVVADVCGNILPAPLPVEEVEYNGCIGIKTYTYTYTDCADLEFVWAYTYIINDTKAPVLVGTLPGGDLGNVCFVNIPAAPDAAVIAALYEDNCGSVTATLSGTEISGDDCGWVVTFTYTVEDECENATIAQVVFTGADAQSPVLTGTLPGGYLDNVCFVDIPLAPDAALIAAEYTDNCGTVSATLILTQAGGDDCGWTVTFTYAVTDECGNDAENAVVVFTGADTEPPALTGIPYPGQTGINACADDATTVVPFDPALAVNGYTDNCGTVTATLLGEILVGGDCDWTVYYFFNVADECGNILTGGFYPISGSDDQPPHLTGTLPGGDLGNVCFDNRPSAPDPLIILAQYTDNCGTVTGTLFNTEEAGDDCGWQVTYTYYVADECGNSLFADVVFTGADTEPPALTGTPYPGVTGVNACAADASTAVPFDPVLAAQGYTDNCGDVYAMLQGNIVVGGDCGWTLYYFFNIEDDCGNVLEQQYYANSGSDSEPPQLKPGMACSDLDLAELNWCLNQALAFDPVSLEEDVANLYTDNCSIVSATYVTTVAGPANSDCEWTYTFVYDVFDACFNTVSCLVTYSGGDTEAPQFKPGMACSDLGQTGLEWCLDVALAFEPESLEGEVAALYTDNCSAVTANYITTIAGTNTDCAWTFTFVYEVSDACFNTVSCLVTYTGSDVEAPQLIPGLACSDLNQTGLEWCLDEAIAFNPENLEADVAALYTDNCSVVTANYVSTVPGAGNSDCAWTFTFVYEVSDACFNSVSCFVTYQGGDVEAPHLRPGLACSDLNEGGLDWCLSEALDFDPVTLESDVAALYIDNCNEVSATYIETIPGLNNSDCEWTFTFVYEVSDACFNTASCLVTYSGGDIEAPQLIAGASIPEGETDLNLCFDNVPVGPTEADIAALFEDNCGNVNVVKSSDPLGDDCSWVITYKYEIFDDCGNYASDIYITYSGGDNEPPQLIGIIPAGESNMNLCFANIPEGPSEEFIAGLFEDNCGNVNVTKTGAPTGDDCDWTVTYNYVIVDDCDNYADEINITYSGSNQVVPQLPADGFATVECIADATAPQPPVVDDFCGITITPGLFSVVDNPDPVICSGTRVYTYRYTYCSGVYSDWKFTYTIVRITPPHEVGGPVPKFATVDCISQAGWPLLPEVYDVCGTELTYSRPVNITTVAYKDGNFCHGGYKRYTFKFKDPCNPGLVFTWTFRYEILPDNEAPILTGGLPGGDFGNVCLAEIPAAPAVSEIASEYTDNCGTVTAQLINTEVLGTDCDWTVNYTYTVRDACGNYAENAVVTYTGGDVEAPVLAGVLPGGSAGNVCLAEIPVAPEGSEIAGYYTDNCGLVIATLIDTDVTGADCEWAVAYTYSIEDECGNFADNAIIIFTGGDTEAPMLTGILPGSALGNVCLANVPEAPAVSEIAAQYTDNCGGEVIVTLIDTEITGTNCDWMAVYTYSIEDECGNFAANAEVIYTGGDTEAPLFTGVLPGGAVGNVCLAEVPAAPAVSEIASQYTDNCGEVIATLIDTEITGTNCDWMAVYTFSIEDECGNFAANAEVIYTGGDTEAPVFSGTLPGGNAGNVCLADVPEAPAESEIADQYTDNCGEVIATLIDTEITGTNCNWMAVYTYSIQDECGNFAASAEVIYTGGDAEAPTLTGTPPGGFVGGLCIVDIPAAPATSEIEALYTDNCGDITASLINTEISGNECNWSVVYTYSVEDECGNVADLLFVTFTGQSTVPPILVDDLITCASLNQSNLPMNLTDAEAFDAETLAEAIAELYISGCGGVVTAELSNTYPGVDNTDGFWSFVYEFMVADVCGNAVTCEVTYSGGLTTISGPLVVDDEQCFDAEGTVVVSDLTVTSSGNVTIVAGYSIQLMPGVMVENGGQLHAFIGDDWCVKTTPLVVAEDILEAGREAFTSEQSFFRVFPNPTTGRFNIELNGVEADSRIVVEITNMIGERIWQSELSGDQLYEVNISNLTLGMYVVRVFYNDKIGIEKLIKR